jgi:hypothetical protein
MAGSPEYTVHVSGYPELKARLDSLDKDVRDGTRDKLLEAAKVIAEIGYGKGMGAADTHLPRSPQWDKLRVGGLRSRATQYEIYIMPTQRGVSSRQSRAQRRGVYRKLSGAQLADRGRVSFPPVFIAHELDPMAAEGKPIFEGMMREMVDKATHE